MDGGVKEADVTAGGKTLEKQIGEDTLKAYLAFLSASTYYAFVMKRRDMKYITSALQAAKPMLEKMSHVVPTLNHLIKKTPTKAGDAIKIACVYTC